MHQWCTVYFLILLFRLIGVGLEELGVEEFVKGNYFNGGTLCG